MADDFSARFSATARHYRYIICNRAIAPGLLSGLVTWQPRALHVEHMQAGAQYLLGIHDFNAFRAAACQAKSARRNLQKLTLERHGDFICMDVMADGFLHHMVRNIAGSLMAVGLGEREPQWIEEILKSQDRRQAGMTAAPSGLYLVKVEYPANYCVPNSSPFPVFW